MGKKIILKLNGSEYELLKEPNLGDIIVFTAIGQVVGREEEDESSLLDGAMLAAVIDVIPNLFEDLKNKEPEEIF